MTSDDSPARRPRRGSAQDSAHAAQLIKLAAPTACPTCGARTRPADTPNGWVCLDAACVWSSSSAATEPIPRTVCSSPDGVHRHVKVQALTAAGGGDALLKRYELGVRTTLRQVEDISVEPDFFQL